ncbi:MAG: hypothetical protein AAFO29_02665 [Actinomycetota bacterium]
MTWGPDNEWSPQERHAAVLEALQALGEAACSTTGEPAEGG